MCVLCMKGLFKGEIKYLEKELGSNYVSIFFLILEVNLSEKSKVVLKFN